MSDYQKLKSLILEAALKEDIPRGEISSLQEQLHKAWLVRHNNEKDRGDPVEYLSFQLGFEAYKHILEEGGSVVEALKAAAEVCDKPISDIDKAKHRKYFHSKRVVESHNDHPQQKKMIKEGTINVKTLKKSSTVNQLISDLLKGKNLSDQLEYLSSTVTSMKTKDLLQQNDIDRLKLAVGIEELSRNDKILFLDKFGCKQKDIADAIGVSVRTVRRVLKGD